MELVEGLAMLAREPPRLPRRCMLWQAERHASGFIQFEQRLLSAMVRRFTLACCALRRVLWAPRTAALPQVAFLASALRNV